MPPNYHVFPIHALPMDFSKKHTWTLWSNARLAENEFCILVEGDLTIKGHLVLDSSDALHEDLWRLGNIPWLHDIGHTSPSLDLNHPIAALIVCGNLIVEGSVINAQTDTGAALFVTGDVSAYNLLAGGSRIEIKGNAHIAECLMAHYEGGELRVDGFVTTPIEIYESHDYETGQPSKTTISIDYLETFFSQEPLKISYIKNTYPNHQELIRHIHTLIHPDMQSNKELRMAIQYGQSVLNHSTLSYPAHPRRENWLKNRLLFKQLTQGLASEAQYYDLLQQMAQHYQQDPENTYNRILEWIPEKFHTPALCTLAARLDRNNFGYIPEHLKTMDFYRPFFSRTFTFNNTSIDLVEDVPEALVNASICEEYIVAQQGNRYAFRSIPSKYCTPELITHAILHHAVYFKDLVSSSDQYGIDFDILALALIHDPDALQSFKEVVEQRLFDQSVWEAIGWNFQQIRSIYQMIDAPEVFDSIVQKHVQVNPSLTALIPK